MLHWIRTLSEEDLAEFLDKINSLGSYGYGVGDYDEPALYKSYETLKWLYAEHWD